MFSSDVCSRSNLKSHSGNRPTRTPYSMNRLFSELFRKFRGVLLEVCETISGGIWQVLRGKIKELYPEKIRKIEKKSFLATI